ncbi:MAG: AsmA family protein [Cryomorphaceae bacterium]|nr:AsmA family protein [Cryomorphaceae bacterium]
MKKALKYFGIILILLFAIILTAPILFKSQLVTFVKKTANENLIADVDFRDVKLSLIKNFPDFTLDVYDFTITGRDTFSGVRLVDIEDFRLTLNLMSVIRGDEIEIKTISLIRPSFHVLAYDSILVNYDIMLPDDPETYDEAVEEEAESDFSLALRRFTIEDMSLIYDDRDGDMYVDIKGLNHQLQGNFTLDDVALSTVTSIEQLTFIMDGITMLSRVKALAEVDLDFNQPNFKIDIKDGSFARLNGLTLKVDGNLAMPEEIISMNMSFESANSDFKELISLIPAYYMADFEGLEAGGEFSFTGKFEGDYDGERELYPAMDIRLKAKNGRIKYPDLPSEITEVHINTAITHPGGDLDRMKIDIFQFTLHLAGQGISGSLGIANPMSDPAISMNIKGKLNLDNVAKVAPLEEGTELKGLMDVDFKFVGKQSQIENERYDSVVAYGRGELTSFYYSDNDMPLPVEISHALMVVRPEVAQVEDFKMKIGASDFNATGRLDNMLQYVLSDQELKGRFNFTSSFLNIDELMTFADEGTEEGATKIDTSAAEEMTVEDIRIPAMIDFRLDANIAKLLYDGMDITNLSGGIHIVDQTLRMDKARMNLMGGLVQMDGYLDTKPEEPIANFDVRLSDIAFKEAYNTLDMVKSFAPIMEKSEGKFTTNFSMQTSLLGDLSPNLSTLKAEGLLRTMGVVVETEVMEKVANVLRNDDYKILKLDDTRAEFTIEDGRLFLKPFDLKSRSLSGKVHGSSGLDQTLDFVMDLNVPFSNVKADQLLSAIGGSTPKNIDLKVNIGGTFTNPKITTSLGDLGKSIGSQVKDQVKDKVEKEVTKAKEQVKERAGEEAEKILAQARAQADKIKSEAKRSADKIRQGGKDAGNKLRDEAKRQGDNLVKEAGSNIIKKRVAQEAADKLVRDAEQQAKRAEDEANKRADNIEREAEQRANKIIEDAENKVEDSL